jgi:hypothetical protein
MEYVSDMEVTRTAFRISVVKPDSQRLLGDLGVHGRVILK